jgi:hypothetical protein
MKIICLFLCFIFNSCNSVSNINYVKQITFGDTLNLLDTAFIDSKNGKIKPPCSISPDYCGCLISRAKKVNIDTNRVVDWLANN